MVIHSSVLAWRILGTAEPGRLPSVGLHRVGHDQSDLTAAAFIFRPSASQLLAFSPGKEQAAGVWETCLAPGWPHLPGESHGQRSLLGSVQSTGLQESDMT